MSLAGNLSDLSLAELLQVVALSRKTGALEICSDEGVAWLGVRDGGIVRVAMEDGAVDRCEVLKRAGVDGNADPDIAEATLWDAAVAGILRVFEWTQGEFTFDPTGDPAESWRGPEGIVLPTALSPEFLALEGARLEDEGGFAEPERATPEPTAPDYAASDDCDAELGQDSPSDPNDWSDLNEESLRALPASMVPRGVAVEPEPIEAPRAEPAPKTPEGGVIVCLHPELELLEALKVELAGCYARVHIFQNASQALTRFKQYIVRGEFPAFVLGSEVDDPVAAPGAGWLALVNRVRSLAPRTGVLVLDPEESGEGEIEGVARVQRPDMPRATAEDVRAFMRAVRSALGVAA